MLIAMVGPFGFHPNKTMRARAFQLARPLAQQGHDVALFMPPWQTPAAAGRVWVEETPGGGSTFWFDLTLPVIETELPPIQYAEKIPAVEDMNQRAADNDNRELPGIRMNLQAYAAGGGVADGSVRMSLNVNELMTLMENHSRRLAGRFRRAGVRRTTG